MAGARLSALQFCKGRRPEGQSVGKFRVDRCPMCHRTCRNFVELCKAGYYDGITFHKIVPDFMCQSGDPSGSGRGGESIYGPTFPDEMCARHSHDRKGIVSMANFGRNTNSSQFFIIFKASPHLDGKHTVFGQVKEKSFEVLDQLHKVKTKKYTPVHPVKLGFVAAVLAAHSLTDVPIKLLGACKIFICSNVVFRRKNGATGFVAEVLDDPWDGLPLPAGAKIPLKPLVGATGPLSCSLQ